MREKTFLCGKTPVFQLFLIALIAFASAMNYAIFVFPNSFAPAGIDGISTMIQDLLGISMGYLSLLINVPLLILAYGILERKFALKTAVYVIFFSASSILIREIDLTSISFYTQNGTSIVLAPLAAGVIRGLLYVPTITVGASSGGVDIIAALVRKKKPYLSLMNVVFMINILVAFCSYFVYGAQFEPVICSVLYSFITSSISNHVQRSMHQAVRFDIIAEDAEMLCREITQGLHETATIVDAYGAVKGTDQKMVICVVSKEKVPGLDDIIKRHSCEVVFKSTVIR